MTTAEFQKEGIVNLALHGSSGITHNRFLLTNCTNNCCLNDYANSNRRKTTKQHILKSWKLLLMTMSQNGQRWIEYKMDAAGTYLNNTYLNVTSEGLQKYGSESGKAIYNEYICSSTEN